MIRSSWMGLQRLFRRFLKWWLGFRWIAVTLGIPLIGISLSKYFWEDLCINQGSLCTFASNLSIVVGGIIVLPLLLGTIRWEGFWWVAGAFVLLALGIGLSWFFWEELHNDRETISSTIRNLSLVIGGFIAIELSIWRSVVGERQTAVAQQQAETAQRDMLNQQLQKGAEMLGSSALSVRLGGIYALRHLAVEHPEQYHVQVMEQLCAFIRGVTRADGEPTATIEETTFSREEILSLFPDRKNAPPELTIEKFVARNDIQEALNAIALCHDRNIEIETTEKYRIDLRGADLRGANFSYMNLSRAPLKYFLPTTLYQMAAIGRYTDMRGTRMDGAILFGANLARVDLSNATGLNQERLDDAMVRPNDVPKLDGADDAKTGDPLVWKEDSSQGG